MNSLRILTLVHIILCGIIKIHAQDYQISFSGSGASSTVESVEVQNLTKNTSITLSQGQILHLKGISTDIDDKTIDNNGLIIYPNPIKDIGYINLKVNLSGNHIINLFDSMGKRVLSTSHFLEKGNHQFTIEGIGKGLYLLNIQSLNFSTTIKFLCTNTSRGVEYINYVGKIVNKDGNRDLKSGGSNDVVEMPYNDGETLLLVANTGKYSAIKSIIPTGTSTEIFDFTDCTDAEGNEYKTVKIGDQVWMAENLKVKQDIHGSTLPNKVSDLDWYNLTASEKAYCYYNNNTNGEADTYGALYTYESAMNCCPTGWHLPSDEDWDDLIYYISQNGYNEKEHTALCSVSGWDDGQGSNKFRFNALPGASRSGFDSSFYGEGWVGYWWSSSFQSNDQARAREIQLGSTRSFFSYKKSGFSVRCVMSEPYIKILSPNDNEVIRRGNIHDISWRDNINSNVRLELWKGLEYYSTIASTIPSNGNYTWQVPIDIPIDNDYAIKIINIDDELIFDMSDEFFQIEAPQDSELLITSPNGGEIWNMNSIESITWTDNFSGPVRIELIESSGVVRYIITTNTPSDGAFEWQIPVDHFPEVNFPYYRIRIICIEDESIRDESDGTFTINGATSGTFTDQRDEQSYNWVKIGEQKWMAENLRYLPSISGIDDRNPSISDYYVTGYDSGASIEEAKKHPNYLGYGVLYDWNATKNVCPSGWRLPTNEDWDQLITFLGGSDVAGGKLKAKGSWLQPNVGATNESGFTGFAGGCYNPTTWHFPQGFILLNQYGYWWSGVSGSTECKVYSLSYAGEDIDNAIVDDTNSGYSIRCVKD